MTAPFPTIYLWWKTVFFALTICILFFSPLSTGQTATADTAIADREAEDVARLLSLISRHHKELAESKRTLPSREELALRDAAQQDAANLAEIPFSADKMHLNGSEGNTALALMTQRLSNHNIPESRRDIALICAIKTHLYGSLIASENHSLKPAGKHQYIARVRLQPGTSTLRVGSNQWQVSLPQDMNAADYLITLYAPPDQVPEFHIFSVADLLAEEKPHIPAWLPREINLKPTTG